MMQEEDSYFHPFEQEEVLGDLVKGVATELRLLDVADLIMYIRAGDFPTLGALIESAVSMYLKPGTLKFANSAEITADWGRAASVWLDFEFESDEVDASFALCLKASAATIQLRRIAFRDDQRIDLRRQLLTRAVKGAYLECPG